ncbi:MAG: glycosyl transferase family 1, partial [Elusimicrobiota bacterium]
MRLLFLCHRFPHPPNEGGKIRAFYFLRHLAQTHDVVVASLAHSEEELIAGAELKEHCSEVIAEVLPNAERWRRAALACVARKSASLAYFWSPRLARRIEQAARERPFDAIVVHCAFAAPYW